MSEGCCGGGACAHKAKSAPTDSAIQNGKGDAPRNVSAKFRKNFDGIRWTARRDLRPGGKFVKTY